MRLFDTLLTKYIAQTISGEETEELFALISESESYKNQYKQYAKLNTLSRIPVFGTYCKRDYAVLKKRIGIHSIGRRLHLWRVAAAAALALVSSAMTVLLSTYLDKTRNVEVAWVETSTPLGGSMRLVLPDGSVAWVNAKSQLKYSSAYGKTDRNLWLQGEGYFEVAKNETLPLTVHAGNMTVTATGTRFNVNSYGDEPRWEVALSEGGVDVAVADRSFRLVPNQMAVYDRKGGEVKVEPFDGALIARWTQGKLSFERASIPDVFRMLERHFNVFIKIESEELKSEYFMGSINLNMSLSAIINHLDVDKKYKTEVNDNIIVVKRRE